MRSELGRTEPPPGDPGSQEPTETCSFGSSGGNRIAPAFLDCSTYIRTYGAVPGALRDCTEYRDYRLGPHRRGRYGVTGTESWGQGPKKATDLRASRKVVQRYQGVRCVIDDTSFIFRMSAGGRNDKMCSNLSGGSSDNKIGLIGQTVWIVSGSCC